METTINRQLARSINQLCCTLLRGERVVWPFGYGRVMIDEFIKEVLFQGVETLVYDRLTYLNDCPARLRHELQQLALSRTAWELRNRALVQEAADAFAAAGIDALIYKGTALAYWLYDNPVWRTRSDTDVIVPVEKVQVAMAVLTKLGYRHSPPTDDVVYSQTSFTNSAPSGGEHDIDLHWQLNDSVLLATLFTHEELFSRAVSLPRLGAGARTVDKVDALLIACLHRGSHKQARYTVGDRSDTSGDRLIWYYDFDRLSRTLTPAQWREFFVRASSKGLSAICAEGLHHARDYFHTPLPLGWDTLLNDTRVSAADSYLNASALRRLWLDLKACDGTVAQISWCRRLLFPPVTYMQNKYGVTATWRLPLLYMRRAIEGLIKRLPVTSANEP